LVYGITIVFLVNQYQKKKKKNKTPYSAEDEEMKRVIRDIKQTIEDEEEEASNDVMVYSLSSLISSSLSLSDAMLVDTQNH